LTKSIAHEAEVQRQHVRLQLPISILIRGIASEVLDWSNSGVAFATAPYRVQQITFTASDVVDANLVFAFGGFTLNVPILCEVRHINSDGSRVGCRFHGMNERNLSIMQYLVSAYIGGDLVQVGDLLDVVSRKNFTTPRTPPSESTLSPEQRRALHRKRKLYTATLALMSVLLVLYCVFSIFERLYVVHAKAATVTLTNRTSGKGGVIVEALMDPKDAVRLAKGMRAVLGFPGYGKYYHGKVYEVLLEDMQKQSARVFVVPEETLPAELLHVPVDVKINVF
jgi:hypothetical protein